MCVCVGMSVCGCTFTSLRVLTLYPCFTVAVLMREVSCVGYTLHTSCMGAPFPIVHAKLFIIFHSSGPTLYLLKPTSSKTI